MKKIRLNVDIVVEVSDDVSPNDLGVAQPQVKVEWPSAPVAASYNARILDWNVVSTAEVK